ncbi:hypothetical protein RJ640_000725 [Escallonia rubra]|uniref:Uncharacterized protein n=1 Tax=Escallonia rubra TaxID=112253 RepID=A0AA88QXF6_9ASTE|nr:hypothetical protein RJ640_000725 [Escallonia rubra]
MNRFRGRERSVDGEIKMGEFMSEQGDKCEAEARLIETHGGKSGLIVERIEFRPNEEPI